MAEEKDSFLVRHLKKWDRRLLHATLPRPGLVIGGAIVLVLAAGSLIPLMGREFLPPFNEGTATIGIGAAPGISLAASDRLGTKIEEAMLSIPEVKSTIRREHAKPSW